MAVKSNKIKSNKIRNSAKGKDCTLRLIGVCNFDSETTVLAHVGYDGGMATKCGDNMAVFACSDCHTEIDKTGREEYAADKLRAIEETQQDHIDSNLLRFG
ncbi:DUF1364 domain-containing protein [Vibrio crassostreae]|uniref:DUF1364 domain-containing protein n=2 Tax=Vibrio cyclitrophicus TaxID=47951 RepID=A0A7Z1S4I6_9VIBR|nr:MULTISPECIES: nuclease domain-containing protein [Vibrio]CAH7222983.1 conserved hypothetical protein [Vibrio chagasii]CAK1880503.1 DUF1364 domain-containing protein [Vibrio crassostreae]PME16815.1 hypothetical protein BCV44_13510 [Vibrio cyclitrophicus]PMP14455.1 hypothetical protein BCS91_11370 [Vibrio cyclitrophicus]PMP32981.1 hypothetical protein BCS90_09610 [Vibrio cyclitrophicus]